MRDNCVHGDVKESIKGLSLFLQRYIDEWKNASLNVLSESGKKTGTLVSGLPTKPVDQHSQWSVPAPGSAKINFDASFILDTGEC